MRFLLPLTLAVTAFLCCPPAEALTNTSGPAVIHVSGRSVRFYYNRFLLEADGAVRVTTSQGMIVTGDAFSMDLKLNRFLVAGHVHVVNASGSQDGAALSDFLDYNRIYFVPIVQTVDASGRDPAVPDRWTFMNGDFVHPAKGREMPGDTFEFPDLGRSKPFLLAGAATVGARSYVRFEGNRIDLLNGLGAYVPTPSYYVNFSDNQHLGANSLAGASYDATYQFAGNANSISAVHLRNDPTNGTYLSFEQHVSGPKTYAVFSINPMTKPSKYFNLLLSDQPSDTFQLRTFTTFHTFQYGLSQPLESGQTTLIQATQALPHSFLQLSTTLTNYDMLAPKPEGYDGHGTLPNHPFSAQLNWQGFTQRIGKLPLYEAVNAGMGVQHDVFGLQQLGGVTYSSIWQHFAGLELFVPSLKIGNNPADTKNYYVNAAFQKNRTWNSSGHYTDTALTSGSLSRTFDRHFQSYIAYAVNNTGDYYGTMQNLAYPSYVPVIGGVPIYGYAAFAGFATFRTLSLDLTYGNGSNFSAYVLARKHNDFPKPVPGLFPAPPLNVIGQQQYPYYLGQPPYDLTLDVRARINAFSAIDIARTYYFNFGNQRWSPGFVIQVTQ
ncbi:MAG TPA: hypothetical protein VFE17_04515 [Candidatus Baltobacteraceae bacterium]|jgi:hypothetical protein|nr:hypothetical protein [Candidatus Baltobacteraceae bacterium]